jgi:hypothetical protein
MIGREHPERAPLEIARRVAFLGPLCPATLSNSHARQGMLSPRKGAGLGTRNFRCSEME